MLPTPYPGRGKRSLRSRFVPGYPPVVPYSGPLEPDEPRQPSEPMPLKTRLQFFLDKVSGIRDL